MIIDFHTHIFPEKIRENREQYFAGEADFELLYGQADSKLAGARQLIDTMDEQGVDVSVVFGFPWKNSSTLKRHNDYIHDAVARFPQRIRGFCCLDPFSDDAANEAERCLEAGFDGIGEMAFYRSGISAEVLKRLDPVMAVGRQYDVPVLVHTNEPIGHPYPGKSPLTLGQIYRFVRGFPENRIVLAHWGGGIFFFSLMKKEVRESLKNTYYDTAASPFLYDPAIYRAAVQIIGPGKVLFGSDYPLLKPHRYFEEMKSSGLSPSEMKRICGGNASQMLNH